MRIVQKASTHNFLQLSDSFPGPVLVHIVLGERKKEKKKTLMKSFQNIPLERQQPFFFFSLEYVIGLYNFLLQVTQKVWKQIQVISC